MLRDPDMLRQGDIVRQWLRRPAAALLAAACALFLSACARVQVVRLDTRPADAKGASIYVNGEKRGVTPATVELSFGADPEQRVLIQVVKPNYKPAFQYWAWSEVPLERTFDLEDE